jgi:hypothetical protein
MTLSALLEEGLVMRIAIVSLALLSFFSAPPTASAQARSRPIVSDVQAQNVATFTVHVTAAPAHAEARAATPGRPEIKLINGKPLMSLTGEANARTSEVPQGTFILLRASPQSGAVGYTVTPPGILEPPPGVYHLPNGAIGILRAVNLGAATVTIKGLPRRPTSALVTNSSASPNWSGYALSSGPFFSVSGEWTVPTVFGDAGDHSSIWIGIDGRDNDSLIQVGTAQNYSSGFLGTGLGGGPEYYAWWEVLPDSEEQFPNPVSPGDHMIAVVSLRGEPAPGSPMTWLIFLMNQTQHWTATRTVTYSGPLASAEWIVEAPQACLIDHHFCSNALADYGSATFDVFDTVNSLSPGLTPSSSIVLVQGGNNVSTPSDPDGDKDGFTVAFGSQKPLPPGPIITTTSLPVAYLNFPYQTRLFAQGASSFQWFASNLPAWLTLDRNTGVLSGTPPTPSLNVFSVIARDATNQNVSSQIQPLEVTVQGTPPPPDFSLSADPVEIRLSRSSTACAGSTTITVNPLYGFNSAVRLTASGAGVTSAHYNPSSTHSTSRLTLTSTLCHSTTDEHLVTITGMSGSITHSIAVDLVPQSTTGPCSITEGRRLRICNTGP